MAAPPRSAGFANASTRRLVAVWFADIVGYSGLASRDEEAALQQVNNFQTACQAAVGSHGGRLVKFLGDGAFAEFPSTESAVRAAVAVRDQFSDADTATRAEGRVRIGVHVGDVIARQDGDLYGDGVNTASRLQAEARPGQILVTGDVWRQLRSLRGLRFRSLGSRELRGIAHPIEVYALVVGDEGKGGGGGGRFLHDLKRRHAFRVGAAYLLVALLVVEIAAMLGPSLGLPGWTTTVLIALAVLGLPIALVLAWAHELTPGGERQGEGEEGAGLPAAAPRGRSGVRGAPAAKEGGAKDPRARLPEETVALIGRDSEAARVGAMLAEPGHRLVTITGPGGVGKTSLALRVARENVESFRDGVVFVPLAAQDSAAAVLPLVAEHLGLRLGPGVDARAQVTDFLRDKEMLIVLDNFEQLVEHAGTLAGMLEEAPHVRALVTSRERLNLKQEVVYPLDGLAVGDPAEILASPAGRLFTAAARRSNPDFEVSEAERHYLVSLCDYLEGVPLALELAATWTRAMGCREILSEVRRNLGFLSSSFQDVPERHRSLSAVFESAWQLLNDEERTALQRLSIFNGPFGMDAVSAVVGADHRVLAALLDQSLLRRRRDGRFEMLEVIRQYAAAKLAADRLQSDWISERHAVHYLGRLSPPAAGADAGPSGGAGAELDDVRTAWGWAATAGRIDLLDAALEGIYDLFNARGRVAEGASLLQETVETLRVGSAAGGAGRLITRLEIRQGAFCASLGRYAEAEALLESALAVAQANRMTEEAARAVENLGRIAHFRGEDARARELYEQSRDAYEKAGDQRGLGRALLGLGNVAYRTAQYGAAKDLYHRSLSLLSDSRDAGALAGAVCNLGVLAWTEGDPATARQLLDRSLALAQASNDHESVVTALHNLGVVAYLGNDHARAEKSLREGLELSRRMGFRRHVAGFLNMLGKVLDAQGRSREAAENCREAIESARAISETPALLEAIVTCASLVRGAAPAEALAAARFVHGHPSADPECRASAEKLLAELREKVPEPTTAEPSGGSEPSALDPVIADLLAALDRLDSTESFPTLLPEEVP